MLISRPAKPAVCGTTVLHSDLVERRRYYTHCAHAGVLSRICFAPGRRTHIDSSVCIFTVAAFSTALQHKVNASVGDLGLSQRTLAQSLRLSHALEYGNGGLRWLICEFRNDAADMFGDVPRVICCVSVVALGEDRTCTRAALRELYLYWLLFMPRGALEGQRRTHEQP